MSNSVILAEDEVVLREYKVTELDYRTKTFKPVRIKGKKRGKYYTGGNMYVTNRRLIYNVDNRSFPVFGLKCKDMCSQQIRISDVQGVDFMTSTMKGSLILPILLILLGVVLLTMLIGIIPLVIGLIWLFIRIRNVETSMIFGIRSQASDYGMVISEMSRGYLGNVSYWCAPAEDFERMSRELGAIVLDIQKYGDEAISKWASAPVSGQTQPVVEDNE